MTDTLDSNKYLLSREAIESAMERPPIIGEREPWGHLVGVVVGGGAYSPKAIATHMRVIGTGGRMAKDRRRIETRAVPLYSHYSDLTALANHLLAYVADLQNVTIAVDPQGLGAYFLQLLDVMAPGTRKSEARFGGAPGREDSAQRFFTRRAQAYVHTAEGIRDGVVRIDHMPDTMVEQGSTQPYTLDAQGRYHVKVDGQQERPCLFDTLAMAFLDGVDYTPAVTGLMPGARGMDVARIEQDAQRGIGASSGDTLRLLAEVKEYRRLKAEFDNIPSRRQGR